MVSCCSWDAEGIAAYRREQTRRSCCQSSCILCCPGVISASTCSQVKAKRRRHEKSTRAIWVETLGEEITRKRAIFIITHPFCFYQTKSCSIVRRGIANLYCIHVFLLRGTFVFPPNSQRSAVNFLPGRVYISTFEFSAREKKYIHSGFSVL